MKIAQFGTIDDARAAIGDYIRANTFFVTFLELTDNADVLMQQLKRKNPRLPVVDHRRRGRPAPASRSAARAAPISI